MSATVVGWQALRYFYGRLLASADLSVEQSSVRDRKAYRRATERWENEGGSTLTSGACVMADGTLRDLAGGDAEAISNGA